MKIHVLIIVAALSIVWGFSHWRYTVGYNAADTRWKLRQSQLEKANTEALLKQENQERTREQQLQTEINKVTLYAEEELAAARGATIDAERSGQRLQQTVGTLRRQLADRETRCLSSTAAINKDSSRKQTGVLFAELFRRADQRAGELAAYADRTRIKWQACERAYNAVTHQAEEESQRQ